MFCFLFPQYNIELNCLYSGAALQEVIEKREQQIIRGKSSEVQAFKV